MRAAELTQIFLFLLKGRDTQTNYQTSWPYVSKSLRETANLPIFQDKNTPSNLEKGKQIRATELRNWCEHVDALVEMGRTIILHELCICARKSGYTFLEKNQLKFNFLVSVHMLFWGKKCRHNFTLFLLL